MEPKIKGHYNENNNIKLSSPWDENPFIIHFHKLQLMATRRKQLRCGKKEKHLLTLFHILQIYGY